MIQELISRYKRMRTEHYLAQTYQCQYAFVGMGQHSLVNLYPVFHHLGVPLRYICVTSEHKARLIARKFPHVQVTTSLDEILQDEAVKGVFVCASPSAHFSLASQVLTSGASLFIEKPPCQTLAELETLTDLQRLHGSPVAMVGLQKRYAPAVQLLKKRLRKEQLISYDLHYLTGAYPERLRVGGQGPGIRLRVGERSSGMGDALLDLYIHPLDLVCHLFGQPEILACNRKATGRRARPGRSTFVACQSKNVAKNSYILMLQHPHIVGTLELSTAYTWTDAEEALKVCTRSGVYRLAQMEELTFTRTPSTTFGIPMEKLRPHHKTTEYLYRRNDFTPILPNSQIYSQGYFSEISAFVEAVEGRDTNVLTGIDTLRTTYQLLHDIQSPNQ